MTGGNLNFKMFLTLIAPFLPGPSVPRFWPFSLPETVGRGARPNCAQICTRDQSRGNSGGPLLAGKNGRKKRRKKRSPCTRTIEPEVASRTWLDDVIKFKLVLFYRGQLSKYSYHVAGQAVLAKYSSYVPEERGREAGEASTGSTESKREGSSLSLNAKAFTATRDCVYGWQHDTA